MVLKFELRKLFVAYTSFSLCYTRQSQKMGRTQRVKVAKAVESSRTRGEVVESDSAQLVAGEVACGG